MNPPCSCMSNTLLIHQHFGRKLLYMNINSTWYIIIKLREHRKPWRVDRLGLSIAVKRDTILFLEILGIGYFRKFIIRAFRIDIPTLYWTYWIFANTNVKKTLSAFSGAVMFKFSLFCALIFFAGNLKMVLSFISDLSTYNQAQKTVERRQALIRLKLYS